RLRGDLLPARLLSPSFQSQNPLSAAFPLAYDEIPANPELRTPRQLYQPTRATPRAGRFLTRKEERPERRYPRLPSASLLCTPSREREAAEVMPLGRAGQNVPPTSERLAPRFRLAQSGVRFGKQYSVGQRRSFHSASRPRTR